MKLNWGTGIAIVLTAFIIFILALVYLTTTAEADLVAPDYYKQELAFQDRIDASKNGAELSATLNVAQQNDQILITCDGTIEPAMHNGIVSFYRPDDPVDATNR